MNFINSIGSGFTRYFDFKTRSSRSEYWWFSLFCLMGMYGLAFIDVFSGTYDAETGIGLYSAIFNIFVLIPSISVSARRLHDIGKSGWWNLLYITIIGIFVLLYWFVQPGSEEDNKFGSNPLKKDETPAEAPAE